MEAGRYEEAERHFERALEAATAGYGAGSGDVQVCFSHLGDLYTASKQYTRGIAYYQKAVGIAQARYTEEETPPLRRGLAAALNDLAFCFYAHGDLHPKQSLPRLTAYNQSLAEYDKALALLEGAARYEVLANRGSLLMNVGRYRDARQALEEALQVHDAAPTPPKGPSRRDLDSQRRSAHRRYLRRQLCAAALTLQAAYRRYKARREARQALFAAHAEGILLLQRTGQGLAARRALRWRGFKTKFLEFMTHSPLLSHTSYGSLMTAGTEPQQHASPGSPSLFEAQAAPLILRRAPRRSAAAAHRRSSLAVAAGEASGAVPTLLLLASMAEAASARAPLLRTLAGLAPDAGAGAFPLLHALLRTATAGGVYDKTVAGDDPKLLASVQAAALVLPAAPRSDLASAAATPLVNALAEPPPLASAAATPLCIPAAPPPPLVPMAAAPLVRRAPAVPLCGVSAAPLVQAAARRRSSLALVAAALSGARPAEAARLGVSVVAAAQDGVADAATETDVALEPLAPRPPCRKASGEDGERKITLDDSVSCAGSASHSGHGGGARGSRASARGSWQYVPPSPELRMRAASIDFSQPGSSSAHDLGARHICLSTPVSISPNQTFSRLAPPSPDPDVAGAAQPDPALVGERDALLREVQALREAAAAAEAEKAAPLMGRAAPELAQPVRVVTGATFPCEPAGPCYRRVPQGPPAVPVYAGAQPWWGGGLPAPPVAHATDFESRVSRFLQFTRRHPSTARPASSAAPSPTCYDFEGSQNTQYYPAMSSPMPHPPAGASPGPAYPRAKCAAPEAWRGEPQRPPLP
eukprot:TRINITY_DN4097_c0_g5_i1.p1 TRINITY_DN4097_c0_g5~~TRINITY_DN4097_c0_g5_i1.p1  ORF type:complete len:865 (+),score=236.32 TRINITY_DN4097_c0_g5_i1:158-2596(+)